MSTANAYPGFESVFHGGDHRILSALPTPHDHPVRSLPTWSKKTGTAVIPRSDWQNYVFEDRRVKVPILDQDGHGACVGYASTAGGMIERDRSGATFELLSADQLYTWINGGVDMGANGGDAVQAMMRYGIAPASLVQGRPIRPAGYSDAAKAAGLRFKLKDAAQVSSIEEAVTAVIFGWQLIFDVCAGNGYDTDSNGVVRYLGRMTNHEQTAGEGIRIVDGQVQILGRNSWATTWGMQGFGWFTEQHFATSNLTIALKGMIEDPQDPNAVPTLTT